MTKEEIQLEIVRVESLLKTNRHPFTVKQNRKYLQKLKNKLSKM